MAKIAKILFACVIGLYAAALTNVAKLWWQALAQNDTAPRGELLNEKNIAPTVPHVGESQIGDESSQEKRAAHEAWLRVKLGDDPQADKTRQQASITVGHVQATMPCHHREDAR